MGLGDKIGNWIEDWADYFKDKLRGWMLRSLAEGANKFLDDMKPGARDSMRTSLTKLCDNPLLPAETKDILNKALTGEGELPLFLLIPLGIIFLIPMILGLSEPLSRLFVYQQEQLLQSGRLDPGMAMRLWLLAGRLGVFRPEWYEKAGFTEKEARLLFEFDYEKDLKDLGWTDERIQLFKSASHYMPPATDVIRWAAREVFDKDLREHFQIDKDFPDEFLEWAQKVGMTGDVARNYWAAHWELPSFTNIIEMWHRGFIKEPDVDEFFKELDMVPYWRELLKKIAFMPFTRVDTRRMYQVGVLEDKDVFMAYSDIGFSPYAPGHEHTTREEAWECPTCREFSKAGRMTAFTKKYSRRVDDEETKEELRFSKAEILDGYRKKLLSPEETDIALGRLDYSQDEIDYYKSREDYKRDHELIDAYISNVRSLYVEGIIDERGISELLEPIGVGLEEIGTYLPIWQLERTRRVERPTRADLDRFIKADVIDESTWAIEMGIRGFSKRYISWYRQLREKKAEEE